MKTCFVYLFFLTFFIASCNRSKNIEGFDQVKWKEDFNACKNQRPELARILLNQKDELKKLDDDAITDLLGTPERMRQFPKGEKKYIYFLYPGKQCINDTSGAEGKKLVIEFDAIGNPKIIRESTQDY
jgi:hypothetical protein